MNKELVFYSEVTNLKTLGFYDSAWTQCGVISKISKNYKVEEFDEEVLPFSCHYTFTVN